MFLFVCLWILEEHRNEKKYVFMFILNLEIRIYVMARVIFCLLLIALNILSKSVGG